MRLFAFVDVNVRRKLDLEERKEERSKVFEHANQAGKSLLSTECYSDDLRTRVNALSRKTLSVSEINERRRRIVGAVGQKVNVNNATVQLRKLMAMYDELFFDNTLEDGILAWKTCSTNRTFRVESKVEKSAVEKGVAGITYIDDDTAGIKIDIATVLETEFNRKPWVGRVPCKDVIACICLLVEHELCHLWCFLYKEAAMKRGVHSAVFKSIMRRLFHQTEIHHKLGKPNGKDLTRRQECTGRQCSWVA